MAAVTWAMALPPLPARPSLSRSFARAPRPRGRLSRVMPRAGPDNEPAPRSQRRRSTVTRLSDLVLLFPERAERYLNSKKYRKPLWCAISGFGGYYVGNVVNLTFGTLGVNDVVAAGMIVGVVEVIGENFWTGYWQGQINTAWLFANCAKLGCMYAFIMDAFKLGGYNETSLADKSDLQRRMALAAAREAQPEWC